MNCSRDAWRSACQAGMTGMLRDCKPGKTVRCRVLPWTRLVRRLQSTLCKRLTRWNKQVRVCLDFFDFGILVIIFVQINTLYWMNDENLVLSSCCLKLLLLAFNTLKLSQQQLQLCNTSCCIPWIPQYCWLSTKNAQTILVSS